MNIKLIQAECHKRLKFISDKFTGKVITNYNQGGVTDTTVVEKQREHIPELQQAIEEILDGLLSYKIKDGKVVELEKTKYLRDKESDGLD